MREFYVLTVLAIVVLFSCENDPQGLSEEDVESLVEIIEEENQIETRKNKQTKVVDIYNLNKVPLDSINTIELDNPLEYLSLEINYFENDTDYLKDSIFRVNSNSVDLNRVYSLDRIIYNLSMTIIYTEVTMRVNYLSKDKSLIKSEDFKITKPVSPGDELRVKISLTPPRGSYKIKTELISVKTI
jgi:hypothetical protein